MLFTTFLLATAAATAAVLGSMLMSRRKDTERTHLSPGLAVVAGAALALVVLGLSLA